MTSLLESIESFDDFNLRPTLVQSIYDYGFEKPSIIQQKGIKCIIDGHDVVGNAKSGTGKTGAFTIAALQLIDYNLKQCQVLILAPTRELAQQIQKVVNSLGKKFDIICHACVGGTDLREDVNRLRSGVHLVVGTPGRVYDMLDTRRALSVDALKLFVVDEADNMLSRGFKERLHDIFRIIPKKTQIALFSGTLPNDINELILKYMKAPKNIELKSDALSLKGIKQFYINVYEERNKFEILCDILESLSTISCVIYVNSRRKADLLHDCLLREDLTVSKIHGDMPQHQREMIMKEFKSDSTPILVTTDLHPRGLDHDVSFVINYDIPSPADNYLQRVGKSGSFSRNAIALNFITDEERSELRTLEDYYNVEIRDMPRDLNYLLQLLQ